MSIQVTRVEASNLKPRPKDESKLGFGQHFTDHMFMMDYEPEKGWHGARIVPHGPLSLDPAAMALHYGQAVFEGLKAYRGKDDGVYLFRYRDNFERLNRSCDRLEIPQFPADLAAEGLIGATGNLWRPDGKLVASGASQLFCRPRPERFR